MIPVILAESYSWRSGVDDIRACLFCKHGNGEQLAAMRRCSSPDVNGTSRIAASSRTMDCHVARSTAGPCGIEARFLKLRGE